MDSLNNIVNWLFNDRMGVFALLGGGVVLSLVVAFMLEKNMRKQFYNHKKGPDDWDLFDSDEE